jgi:ATP-dependent RNA helicase SUPV3L1/SUV3
MDKQEMKDFYFKSIAKNIVIHCGGTNSGKTYNSIQRLKLAQNGAYLAPLRLLAFENYHKLNSEGIATSLRTGEERIEVEDSKVISSTIEMFNYNKYYDIVVIDECFMIGDKNRGKSWFKAIMKSNAAEVHIITNPEALEFIINILNLMKCSYELKKYERLTPLTVADKEFTIESPDIDKTIFVVFSRKSVLSLKYYFEKIRKVKVSVLYGDLPPEVKKVQIQNFIEGKTNVCISTDVIGMGVNLPCNRVCFADIEKFDGENFRVINETEIKQIGGRAGRYGLSQKGEVATAHGSFIDYIKKAMKSEISVTKTFIGLEYEVFKHLKGNNLNNKLNSFKTMDIISEDFKSFVEVEDLQPYYDVIDINKTITKLPDDVAFSIMTLPIRRTSHEYISYIIDRLFNNGKIVLPQKIDIEKINSDKALKTVENYVIDIDLYLNMLNNRYLKQYCQFTDYEKINKYKYENIDLINDYLVSKVSKRKNGKQ